MTVTPADGTAGSVSLTATGTFGTAVVDASGVSCSGPVGMPITCSGSATITATQAFVWIAEQRISLSGAHAGEFSVGIGNCPTGLHLGETCQLSSITFTVGALGARSATLSAIVDHGTPTSATLTGTGVAAGSATVTSIDCGSATVGSTAECTGVVQVTAAGGAIKLGSPAYALEGDSAHFDVSAPTSSACAPGQVLHSGSSCNLLAVTFAPTSEGAKTMTVSASLAFGTPGAGQVTGTGYSYSWHAEEWGEWSSACSGSATRSRVVRCQRSDGAFVDEVLCAAGDKPATSEEGESLDGCTFSWVGTGFGACTGGTGSWISGSWAPDLGCGLTEQTRSVMCAFEANSGTRSQTVSCQRSDGAPASALRLKDICEYDLQFSDNYRSIRYRYCQYPHRVTRRNLSPSEARWASEGP